MQLSGFYLAAGGEAALQNVTALLRDEGIETAGNPDLYVRSYAHLGVEDAREITARASARALTERRVFVIAAAQMTVEAQNALLKTLEEPAGDALFFLIVPSPETLLPTLRSRATVLEIAATENDQPIDVQAFFKAGPEKRIEMLKPLLDKTDDDRRDVGSGIAFLAALERYLSAQPAAHADGLKAVYRARKYWTDKGALGKALLEQVALLL